MRKSWLALVAGVGLCGALGTAGAQKGDTGDQPMGKSEKMGGGKSTDEPKKHLGEVDVYLRDAINNTKLLYGYSQLTPGKADSTIEKEGINNIDRALGNSLTHISHVKTLPEAKGMETSKIDTLQRDLMQARSMVGELRSAMKDRAEFASMTAQLFTKLHDADDQFNAIADAQNLTRVDKINVPERQPVKGTSDVPSPMNQPTNKEPGNPPAHEGNPPPSGNY